MASLMKAPILIVGADGLLGSALVASFVAAGRPVVAVGGTGTADPRVTRLAGSVDDDAAAGRLAESVGRLPALPVGAVVNLLRQCDGGRVLDAPPGLLERKLREDLLPQAHAARRLIPVLASGSRVARYLVVGIPYAGTPWLGYGHQSIAAAATRMLVEILRQETADLPVRVQQLTLDTPIRGVGGLTCACTDWPDAADVARRAVETLADADDTRTFIPFKNRMETAP